jgi:hypothetical protein
MAAWPCTTPFDPYKRSAIPTNGNLQVTVDRHSASRPMSSLINRSDQHATRLVHCRSMGNMDYADNPLLCPAFLREGVDVANSRAPQLGAMESLCSNLSHPSQAHTPAPTSGPPGVAKQPRPANVLAAIATIPIHGCELDGHSPSGPSPPTTRTVTDSELVSSARHQFRVAS